MPGPRVRGVVPWFPEGSKGGYDKGFFYGPMPGLSLFHGVEDAGAQGSRDVPWDTPFPLYGMDQILELEKVHIFGIIILREDFFRTFRD